MAATAITTNTTPAQLIMTILTVVKNPVSSGVSGKLTDTWSLSSLVVLTVVACTVTEYWADESSPLIIALVTFPGTLTAPLCRFLLSVVLLLLKLIMYAVMNPLDSVSGIGSHDTLMCVPFNLVALVFVGEGGAEKREKYNGRIQYNYD